MTTVDTTRSARSAHDVLRSCRALVEPALRAAVATLPAATRPVLEYHLGWRDEHGEAVASGAGKAIRPALTLLVAEVVGGAPAVPAAVAVELVHNFSLLHDDVMDRDLTRRHRPTAWALFGIGPAILAGDAALTLALDVLAASGHPRAAEAVRMLGNAVQELVEGQVADLDFERRSDVLLAECIAMAQAKTGALLGGACALGAVFGGGGTRDVARMDRFGRDLGLAFQLVDDLLGIWGDPETTGKPVRNDLRGRKKSLPVVAALSSGTEAGAELGTLYHRERELTEAELARAAELIECAGGRAWCQDRADALLAEALRGLPAGDGAADELRVLARLIARRDH